MLDDQPAAARPARFETADLSQARHGPAADQAAAGVQEIAVDTLAGQAQDATGRNAVDPEPESAAFGEYFFQSLLRIQNEFRRRVRP